jgi:hypothetical protein
MNKKIIMKLIKVKENREIVKKWINKEYLLDTRNHIQIINQLFLGQPFKGDTCARREIHKKLNSYKQQDLKKNKHSDLFITEGDLIEKLVVSKLKCYYCKKSVLILYEKKRENMQWTLDRLDNSLGHTNDNVVICCLKCNLERRCINDDKFLFTKQMRLIKKI